VTTSQWLPRRLVTADVLVADLERIGVRPGMTLLVHCSLSSIGWVVGGEQAVLVALRRVLGDAGTLARRPAQRAPAPFLRRRRPQRRTDPPASDRRPVRNRQHRLAVDRLGGILVTLPDRPDAPAQAVRAW
jgi:aminoglycoside 3-N-acetyltransferase